MNIVVCIHVRRGRGRGRRRREGRGGGERGNEEELGIIYEARMQG